MEKTGQKRINKTLIVGITGNIGAGKSTVIDLIDTPLTKIINLDKLGHTVLRYPQIKNRIVSLFGKYIISKNQIDRNKLRKLVFYNEAILKKYNNIIHPVLIKELKKTIKANKKKYNIIIIEAALIFELGLEKIMDKIILVRSMKLISFLRLHKKLGFIEFNKIFNSQISVKIKSKKSHLIINNNLPLKLTRKIIKEKINNFLVKCFNENK